MAFIKKSKQTNLNIQYFPLDPILLHLISFLFLKESAVSKKKLILLCAYIFEKPLPDVVWRSSMSILQHMVLLHAQVLPDLGKHFHFSYCLTVLSSFSEILHGKIHSPIIQQLQNLISAALIEQKRSRSFFSQGTSGCASDTMYDLWIYV